MGVLGAHHGRLIMHTGEELSSSVHSTHTGSEKCRYFRRKIWSPMCPMPASIQALDGPKRVSFEFLEHLIRQTSWLVSDRLQKKQMNGKWVGRGETSLDKSGASYGQVSICQIAGVTIQTSDDIRLLSPPRGIHWYPAIHTTGHCTPIPCSAAPPTRPQWGRVSGNFRGGERFRNFLWAKHRAVSWLRQPVAGDTGSFATFRNRRMECRENRE